LAGRSAPTDFLQRLTFIAAHCDEKILQVSRHAVELHYLALVGICL
jgi:hypothetical protein